MIKLSKDRVTGIIAITLGIFLILGAVSLPVSVIPDDPGPAVFPILAAVIMLLTGTAMIVQNQSEKDTKKEKKPYFTKEQWMRFLKLLVAFLLYFFLLWILGFIPATLVVLFLVSYLFLGGRKMVIWKQLLFTVAVTFIVYISFQVLLGLRLPPGLFMIF